MLGEPSSHALCNPRYDSVQLGLSESETEEELEIYWKSRRIFSRRAQIGLDIPLATVAIDLPGLYSECKSLNSCSWLGPHSFSTIP